MPTFKRKYVPCCCLFCLVIHVFAKHLLANTCICNGVPIKNYNKLAASVLNSPRANALRALRSLFLFILGCLSCVALALEPDSISVWVFRGIIPILPFLPSFAVSVIIFSPYIGNQVCTCYHVAANTCWLGYC